MKTIKYRIMPIMLLLVFAIAFCVPAMAYYSEYDEQYFPEGSQEYNDLNQATQDWWDAYYDNDQDGMDSAHQSAEDIRSSENYSGGDDGSEYHPWDDGGNSGYSGGGGYYYDPPAPTTYTITASAGTGGSISPSGSTSVTEGTSKNYTITANTGYKIADVKVDGSSIGAASTYTFSSVSSSHSINATFASNASLNAGDATLGDGGSGSLKSGVTKSGYGITVNLPVTASYVSGTTVTASYNFTSAKSVSLESVGGTWQFPINSSSATGARKIYIPVDTSDGTYTITFNIRALDPQATAITGSNVYLTDTKTVTITIDGSMCQRQ